MTPKIDNIEVPLEKLHENTWNPNQQSDRVFAAEIESIKRFGFIDPITVRKHPSKRGAYEIIDGAHRYRALTQMGYDKPVPVNVIKVTDAEAKQLTIVLNETRGEADPFDLSRLLNELRDDVSVDDLFAVMPFDSNEFDALLALADGSGDGGGAGGDGGDDDARDFDTLEPIGDAVLRDKVRLTIFFDDEDARAEFVAGNSEGDHASNISILVANEDGGLFRPFGSDLSTGVGAE